MSLHIFRDTLGDRVTAFHAEFSALAERRLHIHDDQRLRHGLLLAAFAIRFRIGPSEPAEFLPVYVLPRSNAMVKFL